MADVIIRVSMDKLSKVDLARMTADAVSRALSRAAARITKHAKDIVPVRTGRLRDSIIVTPTLKTVTITWNPVDPVNAYHYAKVADVGREGGKTIRAKGDGVLSFWWFRKGVRVFAKSVVQGAMTGGDFSRQMRFLAPLFVREAIIEEMRGIAP